MNSKHTAIILAGGKSSRMGSPKAFLSVNEIPLIEIIVNSLKPYFSEILISSNEINSFDYLNIPVINDEKKDQGPLMGIYSSLKHSNNEKNFVIATDIPVINIECIQKMLDLSEDYNMVVPSNNGKLEPLYAVYSKTVIPYAERLLNTGIRKISHLAVLCSTKIINIDMQSWYKNLNTRHDYEEYLETCKNNLYEVDV